MSGVLWTCWQRLTAKNTNEQLSIAGLVKKKFRMTMAKNTMAVKGKEVKLIPGMAVTAEVKTGKRRVIQFFLRRYG